MILLPAERAHGVRPLFDAEHQRFMLEAIVTGTTPARVWVDDAAAPAAALVFDGHHTVQLAGAVTDDARGWRQLFDREIASSEPGFLKVYVSEVAAAAVFSDLRLERRDRVLYRLGGPATGDRSARLPEGFHVASMGDRFAEVSPLAGFSEVVAEIESGWSSVADFCRHGFGYVAHDGSKIVSWCTAEFLSADHCGTGIETRPDHQRRGLATACASAFVAECVRRGLVAYWDAWATNLPSLTVAERVGFERVADYSILVGDFS